MTLQPGTHRLGPDDGTLALRTGRTGVAAKAGHDLLIHVTKWDATIEVGADVSIELNIDGGSLVVREDHFLVMFDFIKRKYLRYGCSKVAPAAPK